jgi:carboxypeptidase Q
LETGLTFLKNGLTFFKTDQNCIFNTIITNIKNVNFTFIGSTNANKVMTEVLKLLAPINASILDGGGEGTDISPWMLAGVPGASLKNENDKYFYFHHTNGKGYVIF